MVAYLRIFDLIGLTHMNETDHSLVRKLKDTIAQLLELRSANAPMDKVPAHAPKPVRLKRQGLLTIKDIEAAIAAGRE